MPLNFFTRNPTAAAIMTTPARAAATIPMMGPAEMLLPESWSPLLPLLIAAEAVGEAEEVMSCVDVASELLSV